MPNLSKVTDKIENPQGMAKISGVAARVMKHTHAGKMYVKDWRKQIPAGSRWNPGDIGNPTCKICEGTGWTRLEGLPIGHPMFGKMIPCDCVPQPLQIRWEMEMEKGGNASAIAERRTSGNHEE